MKVPSADDLRAHAVAIKPWYALTAADALQCRLDAIADVERLRRMGVLPSMPDWMRDERDGIDDLRQFTTAPLYFWTAQVATVVEQAVGRTPFRRTPFFPPCPPPTASLSNRPSRP